MLTPNCRFALLCLFIPAVLTSVCQDFISTQEQRKLSNDYSNLTPEEIAFKDFSGKSNNDVDFGNQDLCLANPNMYYFVTIYRFQVAVGFLEATYHEHGVCLPRDCSVLLHTTNDPLLLRIYQVRGYNANTKPPLVNVNIKLYDPAQNMKSKPVMFYITCVFILLFVFLSFVSTLILYHRGRKVVLVDIESPQGPQSPQKKEEKRFDWILKSFDFKENLRNLYQTAAEQKQNPNIAIFQFLRVITSYWVIYFHTCGLILSVHRRTEKYKDQAELDYDASPVSDLATSGVLSVEYFFMMTGFLGAYTLVPKLSKEKFTIMTYLNIIKHRILRVRPLYIAALLVFWQVTPYLTTGPRWHVAELNGMLCDNTWWRNILMVDNFVSLRHDLAENGGYCFSYGWYLSVEFQMYLVAVIAFAVYAKYRRIGYLLVIALLLQGFGLALGTHFKFKLDVFAYTTEDFKRLLTDHKWAPYVRWYTFFVGAFWGLLYFEYTKLKKKNLFWVYETKPIISYLTMICGAVLNLFVVLIQFGRDPETMSESERYTWDPVRTLLLAVSMTMILMPLLSNRQFYLKSFFNLRIFQILGKTSYAVYLFQIDFIQLVEYSTTETFPFSYGRLVLESVKVIAATQAFGLFAHLFLEKPMLNIETKLSAPRQAKSIPKDSKARIEMQPKSKRPEDAQRPPPEHVRPPGLESQQSVQKQEDSSPKNFSAMIEIPKSNNEIQDKLRLLPKHVQSVGPETGSCPSTEKEEKGRTTPSSIEENKPISP